MVFRRQGRGERKELDQIGGEYQKGSTGMILIMMTVIKMIFIMMTLSSLFLTGSKTKKQNWGRISKKDERLVRIMTIIIMITLITFITIIRIMHSI